MSEPIKKKKGRTMTPEMLEKLKIAREKGLAKIRENRQKAKLVKPKTPPQKEDITTDEEKEEVLPEDIKGSKTKKKVITPAPVAPVAPVASNSKYSGVRKVKKTKIIYLTDDDSDSEEEIVVKKPAKKTKAPKIEAEPEQHEQQYIDPLLVKYNMY